MSFIQRPPNSPRADLYRCNLCWRSDTQLLIGWANSVQICAIKVNNQVFFIILFFGRIKFVLH